MPKSATVKVEYSKRFTKQLGKAPVPVIRAFRRRRELFLSNPYDPQLHNHPLKGKYKGLRSINITGDWRAVYRETLYHHGHSRRRQIIFVLLGTHSQLYKK